MGLAGLRWPVFLFWDVAGEALWISGYLTIGYLFSSSISAIADVVANAAWLLAALTVTIILGWRVVKAARKIPAA